MAVPDEETPPRTWRQQARRSPATFAISAVCVVLFAVTLALVAARAEDPLSALAHTLWRIDDDAVLRDLGALDLTRVWIDGQWWRTLTTGFLHGSWIHLVLNLIALWSVGTWLERALGAARSGLIFLLAALGGALASIAACEAPMVVGASAGVLGMAGALLVTRLWGPESVRQEIADVSAGALGAMIALCVGLGVVVPVIAQSGHLGGLALGTGASFALLGSMRIPTRAIATAATIALLAIGTYFADHPGHRAKYPLFMAYRWLDDGDGDKALFYFEEALQRSADDPSLANAVAYHLSLAGQELDRAEALVQQALQAEPENPDYLDTLGWIECRRGNFDEGMVWLLRARAAAEGAIAEIDEHIRTCREAPLVPGG
ncbi:MAG: rhomboid family intramembrane serine protease [Nannocystaceae bacterium]